MYNIWDILDCMVSEWREANDEPAKNKPSGVRLMVNTHMTVTHMLDIGRYYLKRVCSSAKSFEARVAGLKTFATTAEAAGLASSAFCSRRAARGSGRFWDEKKYFNFFSLITPPKKLGKFFKILKFFFSSQNPFWTIWEQLIFFIICPL